MPGRNRPTGIAKPPWRGTGGCDFAARPSRSGLDQPIHWTPDADPAVVILANPAERSSAGEPVPLDLIHIRDGSEGRYARHRDIGGDVPVVILSGAPLELAVAALVPLADDSPDRIEAVSRFWRAGRGLEAPDTRLTPRQRQRIPRALRVADAQSQGASYRDIAEALRGIKRLGEEVDWRSSPLRTEAIELLKLGLSLIDGGYLELLHHRHRP